MLGIHTAFNCFIGAWGIINGSNTTTGDPIPQWHSIYPSGISLYTKAGYHNLIITANDNTQADIRPRELSLPARPTDLDSRWAMVGKYSLAAAGPFKLIPEPRKHWR
ncbi:hypothetical protein F4823DRAFT_607589, partial [Ustulina deusta]